MKIEYDIAIRTVGRGGEKYMKLLESIKKLNIQPQNLFIVLPEGANPPKEQIGIETFVYAPKGMMTQRIGALKYIKSPYVLFCDDDLSFDSNFLEKLHSAIVEQEYDIVTGESLELLPSKNIFKVLQNAILAGAYPTIFHKNKFVTILRSSGWSYNRYKPKEGVVLPTQSAAGALFYCRKESIVKLNLEEEVKWAQHGTTAPAEDQIMYYKANKINLKVGVVTDAHFNHLDAKSSVITEEAIRNKLYWSGFNRAVFWYRFIYETEKTICGKIISKIAFGYYVCAHNALYTAKRLISPKKNKNIFILLKGLRAGKKYVKAEEYKKIRKIK